MSQYEELSALSLSKLRKAIKKQEYMSPFHLLSPANLNGKARVDYLACLKNQKAESALAGSLNDPLEEACLCLKSNRAQSAPKYISAILNNLPKKNKYYREVIRAEKMFIVKGLLAILLEKF